MSGDGRKTIAALFVETDGAYFGLPEVDPWDITRDGRKYDGPWPVVAHPPCQRWGRFWPWRSCSAGWRSGLALRASGGLWSGFAWYCNECRKGGES